MERILIAPTGAVVDLSLENILFEEFFLIEPATTTYFWLMSSSRFVGGA